MTKVDLGERVEHYISTRRSNQTKQIYRSALRQFLEYYQHRYGQEKSFKDFVNNIYDESEKPLRDREPVAELELTKFVDYLKERNKSSNSIRQYVARVRGYLTYRNIQTNSKIIGNIPRGGNRPENRKHTWEIDHIRQFVGAAHTMRDKALILCLFQSGLSISDLLDLNYIDIQNDYETHTLPIILKIIRQKTEIDHVTFFGHDAVKYLRRYLDTRVLSLDSPLFTKWTSNTERLTPSAVGERFKEITKKVNFLNKVDVNNGYNPCRPHSLRTAFNSRLWANINDQFREFMMGHSISSVKRTYILKTDDELRELYRDAERYLKIEKTSRDVDLERTTRDAETRKQLKDLSVNVYNLRRENVNLADTQDELGKQLRDLKQTVDDIMGQFEPMGLNIENARAIGRYIRSGQADRDQAIIDNAPRNVENGKIYVELTETQVEQLRQPIDDPKEIQRRKKRKR